MFLLLIIINCSAEKVLQPRTTARFYSVLQPCDIDMEPRLVIAFIYDITKSEWRSDYGRLVKCARKVFKDAAQGSCYVNFVEVNLSGDKICSLKNDFNLSYDCPNFLFFKNGELVTTGIPGVGCNWDFTAGDILQYIKQIWYDDINQVREERVEDLRREQELAAISGYYASPWMWGGPFYRGYVGWTPWYGYRPYHIWAYSGSIIGN